MLFVSLFYSFNSVVLAGSKNQSILFAIFFFFLQVTKIIFD